MTDISNWIFLVLGATGGFALSLFLWWILNHLLVPRIVFSPEVSRSVSEFHPTKTRYQVAMRNLGNRHAYNVKFRLRMSIRDVRKTGDEIYQFINLKLVNEEIFSFRPGLMYRITPLPQETERFSEGMFPENIRTKAMTGHLSMDDLFQEWDGVGMYLEVIATDRFSGGMKFFRSKTYRKPDIRNGVFRGLDHLSIVKQEEFI